ncbi:MAG TPA: hypothetical protein VGN97_21935 [Mesorhizobium sp.]|jgi:hypothetical protein|nr:hypothetical protein [Mesorhizobium sp.]
MRKVPHDTPDMERILMVASRMAARMNMRIEVDDQKKDDFARVRRQAGEPLEADESLKVSAA